MKKNNKIMTILGMFLFLGSLVGCGAPETSANETNSIKDNNSQNSSPSNSLQSNSQDNKSQEANNVANTSENKILVVYYSAQGHTSKFAKAIAERLNADIFEVIPTQIYSNEALDWRDHDSRVSREHDNESLRNIPLTTTTVENWDSYKTVFIGYPIWWGIAAWPIDNFVKNNNFSGKTVIPFATAISSDMGDSGKILRDYAKSGKWLKGKRFYSSESVENAKDWAASEVRR